MLPVKYIANRLDLIVEDSGNCEFLVGSENSLDESRIASINRLRITVVDILQEVVLVAEIPVRTPRWQIEFRPSLLECSNFGQEIKAIADAIDVLDNDDVDLLYRPVVIDQ